MEEKQEQVEEKKEEIKQEDNVTVMPNDITDYDMAREIVELFVNKHMLISAKRGQKILDMAKSMLLDVAHIYYKN